MRTALYFLALFLISSCSNEKSAKTFINGKQVPVLNSSRSSIKIIGLDNVVKDQQFCAYIIQPNLKLQMLAAYIGSDQGQECDFSKSLVDTVRKEIDNCSIQLMVEGDSAYFCLTPRIARSFEFSIAVLSLDKHLNYYVDTLTMKYTVKEPI